MPRVLMVDDEPRVLAGFRRALLGRGLECELREAGNGREALEVLRREPIDVVLSDVQMPGMDGLELLQAIRAESAWETVQVVIVTGLDARDQKARAIELGASDLLTKPVSTAELQARLRNALQLKAYQDDLHARNAVLEEEVRRRTTEIAASRAEVVFRLAKAAELRDEETGLHVVRVGCYCRTIAQTLDLGAAFCDNIFLAGPLHDVGKIGIPDEILLKPGKLDPGEWTVMRRHTQIGAAILSREPGAFEALLSSSGGLRSLVEPRPENPVLAMAADIAMAHHERWDGDGYPRGLAGNDIPLAARICAVADVYDALGSVRPYKPAYPEEQVLAIMADGRGSQFDPEVYDAFGDCLPELQALRRRFVDQLRPNEVLL